MLASQGSRTLIRHAPNIPQLKGATGTSRAIHIPSFARIHPRIPGHLGHTQKLFTQSKHILTRFFGLLTAPGIRVPTSTAAHSFQGPAAAATRGYSSQGFSPHFKSGFFRASQSHFLPRAPRTVAPRGITQLGLQSARNFSSSRPIFQNLVENVPVFGRALYEVDLELKWREQKESMRKSMTGKSSETQQQGHKEMLKPRARALVNDENKPVASKRSTQKEQLEHYFPNPPVSDVTTYLLIPLAPTPTAHVPLADNPGSFLPLSSLARIHTSHETHSIRISSLFSRLDSAHVWERGARYSAFSHCTGAQGVCTMLKVEFIGWTKAEVRSVLGESGTGWCVLEEASTATLNLLGRGFNDFDDSEDSDTLSDTSSVLSDMFESDAYLESSRTPPTVDPAQSLLLPTLDFSSSFMAAVPSPVPATSRRAAPPPNFVPFDDPDSPIDPWSDFDTLSESGTSRTNSWVDPTMSSGWSGFSSQFMARVEDNSRSTV